MAGFELARGCVYRVDPAGGGGSPVVKMSPGISSGGESPVLITGVQTADGDIVLPVVTLEGRKILYTFGEDFGQFNVVGVCLLGRAGGNGQSLSSVVGWFKSHRVARYKDAVSVTLGGGGAYKVYVTGLSIAEADTEFHIQPFIIAGKVAEAP